MICSLKCFCEFFEATSQEKRNAIVKKFKKGTTGPSKGMMVYYSPALQLMRGRLCPDSTLSEKLKALPDRCFIASWPDKLNDARLQANVMAYRAFHAEFGKKKLKAFSNPRLQCLLSTDVAVNLQPDLYAEIDGVPMAWKLGLSKDAPSEQTIRYILQMMWRALKHKGLPLPIHQICYFDVRAGKIYTEMVIDTELEKKLKPVTRALAETWEKAA